MNMERLRFDFNAPRAPTAEELLTLEAGGLLRISTRPTLNLLHHPLCGSVCTVRALRLNVSHAPTSIECSFSTTLLLGAGEWVDRRRHRPHRRGDAHRGNARHMSPTTSSTHKLNPRCSCQRLPMTRRAISARPIVRRVIDTHFEPPFLGLNGIL